MGARFAVLGAGIIGLLTARALLQRGHRVVLVDRGRPASEASWAGGGIVSPLYPWRYGAAVTALADGAQAAHARLAAELRAATGIDPEYNPCGLLLLDPPDRAAALAWARRQRRQMLSYGADGLRLLQPGLAADVQDGLWMPDVGNVRNPRLLQALLADIARHPDATCCWHATVAIAADGRRVTVNGRDEAVDGTVVAAGAWSPQLLRPLGIDLPVVPVRGQMLLYPPQPGLLRRIVLGQGRYLIPRRDGRILAGSTLEYEGFDKTVTAGAQAQLHAAATRLLPALAQVVPEKQWAGLRPGIAGGIPCIECLPGTRLLVNAGHFRNGLVLAPAAALLGVAMLLGEPMALDARPYRLSAARPPVWS